MKRTIILLAIVSTTFLYSCGDSSDTSTTAETSNTEATTSEEEPEEEGNFLANAEALKKAQNMLQELPKFKGQDVQVFQNIHFYGNGRIILELQDPTKLDNIDHYEFKDGAWQEPQPVQISGGGDMKYNLIPLKEIDFATVAKMRNTWVEKAKTVEGAPEDLDHIYLNLIVSSQKRMWLCSAIEGSREKYDIRFSFDGSIEKFEKR